MLSFKPLAVAETGRESDNQVGALRDIYEYRNILQVDLLSLL